MYKTVLTASQIGRERARFGCAVFLRSEHFPFPLWAVQDDFKDPFVSPCPTIIDRG